MSFYDSHDPLCPRHGWTDEQVALLGGDPVCECALISRVRTEAERSARPEIEANERQRLVLAYGGSSSVAAIRAEEREKLRVQVAALPLPSSSFHALEAFRADVLALLLDGAP